MNILICSHPGCVSNATISVRKDPFGKSDEFVSYCPVHAPGLLRGTASDYADGKLWSFLRSVLSQGKDIHLDHADKSYEAYSARLDLAALERVEALKRLLGPQKGTVE